MSIGKRILVFCLGGGAYVGLELLWRRRSHISMFLAGGTCMTLIGCLNEKCTRLALPLRVLTGAGIITAVELVTGLLVNRDHHVWDYRRQRGNIMGQICPAFCLLWVPVSALAIWLDSRIKARIGR